MWTGAVVFPLSSQQYFPRRPRKSPVDEPKSIKKTLGLLQAEEGVRSDQNLFDFVLVWHKNVGHEAEHRIEVFLNNLQSQGFDIEVSFHSLNDNLVFAKLFVPNATCIHYADALGVDLAFQNIYYVPPAPRPLPFMETELTARDKKPAFLERIGDMLDAPKTITSMEKALIIHKLLAKSSFGDKRHEYGVEKLILRGDVLAAYPLHDGDSEWSDDGPLNDRQVLAKYWSNLRMLFKQQPLDLVQKYYGPEVGIYFAWFGFYNKMLIVASIFGVICFVIGFVAFRKNYQIYLDEYCNSNKVMCPRCMLYKCEFEQLKEACFSVRLTQLFDNLMTIMYAAMMSIWATVFMEYWRRNKSILQLRWNLRNVEIDLSMRPEFEEKTKWVRVSEITKTIELYIPKCVLFKRYLITASCITLLICLMITAILGIMIYVKTIEIVLEKNSEDKPMKNINLIASISGSMLSVAFMLSFEWLYVNIALKLTEMENPRTQFEFDKSFTYKFFAVEFVNSYAAIFYIAFIKARFYTYPDDKVIFERMRGIGSDTCQASGCMNDLTMHLLMIFLGKNLINIMKQYLIPRFKMLINYLKERKVGVMRERSVQFLVSHQWEDDYYLYPVDVRHLMTEYKQMIIQFGFVTFFIAAFPLAPLFALISNLFELRLDAYKLSTMFRRPIPRRVANLGAWHDIIIFMTYISIITNAFIIAFTSEFIPREVFRTTFRKGFGGYTDFMLSEFNTSDFSVQFANTKNVTVCYYPGHRYPPSHPRKYQKDEEGWYLLAIRFIAVVVFEHVIFIITGLVAYLIPDIPFVVQQQLTFERENMTAVRRRNLTDKYLKENKAETKDLLKDVKGLKEEKLGL